MDNSEAKTVMKPATWQPMPDNKQSDQRVTNNEQALTLLPVDGVVEVLALRSKICDGNQEKIDSHAKISERQVAHQELGDRHLKAGTEKDDNDSKVANNGSNNDSPDTDSQPNVSHYIFAWIECIRFW